MTTRRIVFGDLYTQKGREWAKKEVEKKKKMGIMENDEKIPMLYRLYRYLLSDIYITHYLNGALTYTRRPNCVW